MYWAYITKKVIHIIYLKPAGKLSVDRRALESRRKSKLRFIYALDKEILTNTNNEREEYADLAGDIEFSED